VGIFEEFRTFLWIWFVHAVIATVLSLPVIILGSRRVHWNRWDLSAFVLPFAVWLLLMANDGQGKTLANLGEPFFFSFALPVAALVRVAIGTRVREVRCSISLLLLLCLVAIGVFFWTPALDE
jgi:hypothetical protein